jgi:hypothetical protein
MADTLTLQLAPVTPDRSLWSADLTPANSSNRLNEIYSIYVGFFFPNPRVFQQLLKIVLLSFSELRLFPVKHSHKRREQLESNQICGAWIQAGRKEKGPSIARNPFTCIFTSVEKECQPANSSTTAALAPNNW